MRRPSLFLPLLLIAASAAGQAPSSPKIVERYKQMLVANPAEGTALDRLWKIYADQGQTAQLIEEYQKDPSFAAQMILGHLQRRTGRLEDASASFRNAAKLDAKSPLPALALARLNAERGQPREAAVAYEQAAALLAANDPALPETLLQLGAAWLDAGDVEKAAAAWEKTVALHPADLALRRRLAETYERNFLPDRALTHLAYLEKNAPPADRPLALQQIARIHQSAGRQDAAIDALMKALDLTGPGNWLRSELESQLIRLHQRYHRTAELETRWKEYAAKNPRDLGACLQLVELYERLGQFEEQRTWLNAAIKLAPKNADYRLKLARLLVRMDDAPSAIALYDQLIGEQPTNADFAFERALLDVQQDATFAAQQRIAALVAARKNDETIRARALEFYVDHRLYDVVEKHLVADATNGGAEPLAALANFYFGQRREVEALRTLQRLVLPTDSPAQQAVARLQIAQLLRAQNALDPAVAEIRLATNLDPQNRDAHLALGDLLAAQGDYPGAQAAFEKAIQASTSDVQRTEADQKLFESFRAQNVAGPAVGAAARSLMAFTPPGGAPAPNPALDQFVAKLQQEAVDQTSESAWLRVARWRLWNRDHKGAFAAAQKALLLKPKSIAAYELFVKIDSLQGESATAVKSLLALSAIDPSNRANYERRAGQLELQVGRLPEALTIFERLAAANPGDPEALTDLALTQQRADRWTAALETWRQVYALSPVSRRKDALNSLLRALDRLALRSEAAALQLKALDDQPGDRERLVAFNELLTFCSQHGELDWLREQFEKRRQLRADDYFTEVALGRILKASGEAARAFEVLADASYAAPNQAEALPELIREAEELHKLDAAVKLQAQLLRIAPQESADGLEKLADLQEKNFAIDDAAQTWERVVARFPRDATAINRAVDFQLEWGVPERALVLLRKARTLEPSNLRTLTHLATLALDSGATDEAQDCLEQILRSTPPEKADDTLYFPALKPTEAGRLQSAYLATVGQRHGRPTPEAMRALRSFWVDDTPLAARGPLRSSERETRLNAIRQLGQIVRAKSDAERVLWIDRWKAQPTAPSETLWALFYVGAGAATLDRVEALLAERPNDPKIAQAFIWLALQSEQYQRLGAWLQDQRRTANERDFFFIALGQSLDSQGGKPPEGLTAALFADGSHLRLWQAAMLFAGRNQFREAIALGQRVFEQSTTQRAAYGIQIANWHLLLGEIEQARTTLRSTLSLTAESLEAPVCVTLRQYYLLLPENERSAFVESYLSTPRAPLHTALTSVILRSLAGDEAAARKALDRLVEMRVISGGEVGEPTTAGGRHLRFVMETGTRLEALKLEPLAAYFWEKSLADEALLQLESDPALSMSREVQQRYYALRGALAQPGDLPRWITAYAKVAPAEGVAKMAETLTSLGAHARAIAIFRQLAQRTPEDPETLRNLLTACRAANDRETAEQVLRETLAANSGLNDVARREFVLQLADLQEQRGDLAAASATLEETAQITPNDTRLLLRLGQLHARAGRAAEAISAYQRLLVFEPGNAAARVALAGIYEKQNRVAEALALLKSSPGSDTAATLAVLLLKNGQPEAAIAAVERLGPTFTRTPLAAFAMPSAGPERFSPPLQVTPVLSLASAFAAQGDGKQARALLHSALGRTDARFSFPLQCKLIELMTPEEGPEAAWREFRRLRRFASASENPVALLGSYLDFAAPQAARLGVGEDFSREVQALWAAGEGPIVAGVTALTSQIEAGTKDALKPTLDQLLARPDAAELALQTVADALAKAKLPEPLARVQERIAQINPVNERNTLNLIRTWHQFGRKDEARARLEVVAARATLAEDGGAQVAQVFAELGDSARALAVYAQVARRDRFARQWPLLLEYARLQMKVGDLPGAKQTLRTAFTHPDNRSFVEIIEWLVAAKKIATADAEIADFYLTLPRQIEMRLALFGYYEKAGQPNNALALAESHPEIIQPALASRLRQLAGASQSFAQVARMLEIRAAETEGPDVYSLELARLEGDWAQAELTASQPEAALAHLRRAHQRHPELFEIASRLSALLAERGDRKTALETLEAFLAVGKDDAELERARGLLGKLRAGG